MSVIDEIKDRIDIVEVVGETVKLRKTGKNYTGFCPFHPNTRTPAFVVFPDSGTWRCFGACNDGGDVISFVMKKEGWDFSEALRVLAERAGVELRPQTPEQVEAEEAYERLRETLENAATFFRHNLLNTPAGERVLAYLHGRNLKDDALERFEIGYAPQEWEVTKQYLIEKGYSESDLLESGLLSERDSGGSYDRFRHRIMIPIRDPRGRMAGFGARAVDPEDMPKFLNSPQTAIFDKGRLLYGLDKARKPIRTLDQAIIVEGYMDVIGLHQAGFENVVSPMGTAISEHQLRLLKRYSRRMVLALDPDVAGIKATMRGLTVARETLDRRADPTFDARGLVRHEGRLDADIRVVTLPEGLDPDEVVAEEPAAWTALLEKAQTIVDYVLSTLTAEQDLDDPKTKAEIAGKVLPLIEDVADSVEREAYRQKLARHLRVDERALLAWRARRSAPSVKPGAPSEARADVAIQEAAGMRVDLQLQRFCLGILLRDPELLYRVDRQLQMLDLARLSDEDFTGTEHQVIFHAIRDALAQDDEEPAKDLRNRLQEPVSTLAEDLASDVEDLDLSAARVMEELLANFLRLRKGNLETSLHYLRFQLQEAQDADEDGQTKREEMWDHAREVQKIASQKDRLDKALSRQGGALLAI